MDTTITMRNTKQQMLDHIRALESRLMEGGRTLNELRHRISVLEGAKALAAPASPAEKLVRINGVQHRVVYERHGQSTRKRFVPVDRSHLDSPVRGDMPF